MAQHARHEAAGRDRFDVPGLVTHGANRFAQPRPLWQSRCCRSRRTRGAVARSFGSRRQLKAGLFRVRRTSDPRQNTRTTAPEKGGTRRFGCHAFFGFSLRVEQYARRLPRFHTGISRKRGAETVYASTIPCRMAYRTSPAVS
jgi:hypothetical protein